MCKIQNTACTTQVINPTTNNYNIAFSNSHSIFDNTPKKISNSTDITREGSNEKTSEVTQPNKQTQYPHKRLNCKIEPFNAEKKPIRQFGKLISEKKVTNVEKITGKHNTARQKINQKFTLNNLKQYPHASDQLETT